MTIEGPFGGPRPLLGAECNLRIMDYGGGRENLDKLKKIVNQLQPTAGSGMMESAYDKNKDTPFVDIDGDRFSLKEFLVLADSYPISTLVIQSETSVDSKLPRPGVDGTTVESKILVEVRYKSHITVEEVVSVSDDIMDNVSFLSGYSLDQDSNSVLFISPSEGISGDSLMDLSNKIKGQGIDLRRAVVTCGVGEA